jgi:hypothetical protein
MHAQIAMNAGALNAEEDADVPRGPPRAFGIAIGAALVLLFAQQVDHECLIKKIIKMTQRKIDDKKLSVITAF